VWKLKGGLRHSYVMQADNKYTLINIILNRQVCRFLPFVSQYRHVPSLETDDILQFTSQII